MPNTYKDGKVFYCQALPLELKPRQPKVNKISKAKLTQLAIKAARIIGSMEALGQPVRPEDQELLNQLYEAVKA